MSCARCDNIGWVCEADPNKPLGGFSKRFDACTCNPKCRGQQCPGCNVGAVPIPPLPRGVNSTFDALNRAARIAIGIVGLLACAIVVASTLVSFWDSRSAPILVVTALFAALGLYIAYATFIRARSPADSAFLLDVLADPFAYMVIVTIGMLLLIAIAMMTGLIPIWSFLRG